VPSEFEQAKSGRAKCRACKEAIVKDSLRLGEAVPNPFGEGEAKHWYHLRCGALRRPEAFLEAAGTIPSDVRELFSLEEQQELSEIAELGKAHYRLCRFVDVQEAPTGRARCQGCRSMIEKGSLRFVLERIEDGMVSGGGFVHVGCAHKYAGAVDSIGERVRSRCNLTEEQWAAVRSTLEEQQALPRVIIERHTA
jgi:hypothetical protein